MLIRYYGHVGQRTGYGKAAEQMCLALAKHPEVELEILPDWTRCDSCPPELANHMRGGASGPYSKAPHAKPDAIIVHTPPADCWRVIKGVECTGGTSTGNRIRLVAYTTWEGVRWFPDAIYDDLLRFDQVWVPSRATEAAVRHKNIRVIPHTFSPTRQWAAQKGRVDLVPFRFYYIGAWTARKNPQGLIRAFCQEFTAGENVELYLQSSASEALLHLALASTGLAERDRPRVLFSNEILSDTAMDALHRTGDCFVTAARGEAWNLPAFEAMLAGRHVISPARLGSDEFLGMTSAALYKSTETFAYLDAQMVAPPAGSTAGTAAIRTTGAQGLTSRSTWREPDLMDLALRMRHAFQMRQRTIDINYDVDLLFGHTTVANKAVNALKDIAS